MKLSDLDHLRDDKRIRFATEEVNGEAVTIVSYMIADSELWKIPYAMECRGSVFNSNGECISRPFHKFFNIGENEQTQLHHVQGKTFEMLEKRDGSLLVPVMVGGKIAWKTKKSFYSDVAVEAAENVPSEVHDFAAHCLKYDHTPIFEYTSPSNKIVMNYGDKPEFVLLAVRFNSTGEYVDYDEMLAIRKKFAGIKIIQKFNLTVEDCIKQAKTLENFEGWCLRDVKTGFYCKQKTQWYLRNHRAQTELRERDIADMVIDETIDDIKSALALDGFDISPIEEIEHKVSSQITELRDYVDEEIAVFIDDKTNFKQISNDYKDHKLFGLIMSAVRGKEPDYKKFWVNNYRNGYSLKCVYNKNF